MRYMTEVESGVFKSGALVYKSIELYAHKGPKCVLKNFDGVVILNCGLDKNDKYHVKLFERLGEQGQAFLKVDVDICLDQENAIQTVIEAYTRRITGLISAHAHMKKSPRGTELRQRELNEFKKILRTLGVKNETLTQYEIK